MKKYFLVITILLLLTGCNKQPVNNGDLELTNNYTKSEYVTTNSTVINKLSDDNFLLYTYLPYCMFKIPCDSIFKKIMDKYNLSVYSIPFDEFKNTKYYDTVKYAPSMMIISKGEIVAYLDANSKDDYNRYQDSKEFEKWLGKYVKLE